RFSLPLLPSGPGGVQAALSADPQISVTDEHIAQPGAPAKDRPGHLRSFQLNPEYIRSDPRRQCGKARLPGFLWPSTMGDSQQPKPALPQFEVPDLELEPVPRSKRALPAAVSAGAPKLAREYEYGGANLFDDDALSAGSPTLDLASDVEQ